MKLLLITAILAFAFMPVANGAEPVFHVKGRHVGQSVEEACQGASVRSMETTLRAAGLVDAVFPAEACDVYIGSVAGVPASEYGKLLFWEGRLIRLIVPFGATELESVAALRTSLVSLHGTPSTRRQQGWQTDTWAKRAERLELERTTGMTINMGLYLTHGPGWAQYQKARERFDAVLAAQRQVRREQDLVR